ncbi:glycosyltransferase [Cronobacter sakazakii]|nr:glycosyltransferase [Cronobacter sakazakii]
MRIAIVIPTLTIGGAEKVALNTAMTLANMGNEIHVIVMSRRVDLEVPDNITLHTGLHSIKSISHVIKKIRPERCISYMERANLTAAIACRIAKVKHYATVHTAPAVGFRMRSLQNRLAIAFTYRLLRVLDTKVICVCKGVAADLKRMYGIKNLYVVPNFIDVEEMMTLAHQENHSQYYDFTYVGRLSRVKGCHIFIKSLALIKQQLEAHNIKVAIVGDGQERSFIEDLINKSQLSGIVTMLGAKKNPYPIINNSKYVVVPSYAEGFGMVVLESLALGKKVIYSHCDFGPREIINDNFRELQHLGFSDPSVNEDTAIQQLRSIIEKEIVSETICEQHVLIEQVASKYNKEIICKRLLEILDK